MRSQVASSLRRAACRSGGFTLIELVIVIAVISIIGVLAAPSLTPALARIKLRGAAAEAYGDMQFARSEAVQRNLAVTVSFSATGYQVTQGATVLKSVTLDGGNSVTSGSAMVAVFSPVRATAAVSNGPAVFGNSGASGTARLTVNLLGRAELCSADGLAGVIAC